LYIRFCPVQAEHFWPIARSFPLSGKNIGYQKWEKPGGLQHEG
jgi:hypothetical protein